MIQTKLKGMGVALITPFKEDESVDYEAHTQFLRQPFGVGHHSEDTDRAGQCGRFGNDGFGITGDVVTA